MIVSRIYSFAQRVNSLSCRSETQANDKDPLFSAEAAKLSTGEKATVFTPACKYIAEGETRKVTARMH